MRITPKQRKKLEAYLHKFYSYYPEEKYTVFHFVKYLKKRLKDNKDAWIAVTGDTAVGKSLFVLMCQILFGRPFDLTKNVTYIPKGNEIMEKFLALNFNTLLIDEAAQQMRKTQWQDKQQQRVNIATMTERFRNNAVFLNMPNFNEFTKSLRTGSLMFRAVVAYRNDKFARVIIQRKSRNWRSEDPWKDAAANKLYEALEKKRKEISNDVILNIERSLPNTIIDFIVPNLELILPDVTDEYQRLKLKSREKEKEIDMKLGKDKKNIYKEKYEKLMIRTVKVLFHNELHIGKIRTTKGDIAASLNIGIETLNRYLKRDISEYDKKPLFRKNLDKQE